MEFDLLSTLPLTGTQLSLVFKTVLIVFLLVYLLISFLVSRQIQVMNKVLTTADHGKITAYGNLNLLLALAVLILVIIFF
ncbi:MAG: hypothetical protein Q8P13_00535 [bacterium]|nr:hypothetical protein [bacterium]